MTDFEPTIIAFVCNWCTYTAADLAGTSRLSYPKNVRLIRVMCTGMVDSQYVIKALLEGADGVLVSGCQILIFQLPKYTKTFDRVLTNKLERRNANE